MLDGVRSAIAYYNHLWSLVAGRWVKLAIML